MARPQRRPFRWPVSLPGEEFLIVFRRHPAVIIWPTLISITAGFLFFAELLEPPSGISLAFLLIIFGLIFARGIWKIAQWWVGYIALASNRIVFCSGLVRRKVIEISLTKVFDISMRCSIRGLFLGHAEFRFRSMSQEHPVWVMDHVPYPPQLFSEVYRATFPEAEESEASDRLINAEGWGGRLQSFIRRVNL
jgi:hypothetical protein